MGFPLLGVAAGTAALGGIAGLLSAGQESRKNRDQLERQKGLAWQKYLYGKEKSDKERRLGDSVSTNIDQFNTGLLGQAMGLHNAQIETSSGIGSSLAAEAASGTRGSGAGGLVRDYAQKNMDRQVDLAERQNQNQLYAMMTGANQNWEDIDRERFSWGKDGYRTGLKLVNDDYNRKMALLGQKEFDYRIEDTKLTGLDYATAFLSGANSGWNFGSNIGGMIQQHGNGFGETPVFDKLGGRLLPYNTGDILNIGGALNSPRLNQWMWE